MFLEKDKYCIISHIWNPQKKSKLIDTENRLVVTRGRGGGVGKMDEADQKVQTSSYKNKSLEYNV